jgi:hypothetical protein
MLDGLLKLFDSSSLTSIEVFLDDTEEIKGIRCYIRGIRQMKHSYEFFVVRNSAIVFELWSLTLSMWRKNYFRHSILMECQSNNITEIFAFE